jgi:hypothetical protein
MADFLYLKTSECTDYKREKEDKLGWKCQEIHLEELEESQEEETERKWEV